MISLSKVDFFSLHFYYLVQLFHPHNRTLTEYRQPSPIAIANGIYNYFICRSNMLGFSTLNCDCAACGHLIYNSYIRYVKHMYVNGVGMQSVVARCRRKKNPYENAAADGDGRHTYFSFLFFLHFVKLN